MEEEPVVSQPSRAVPRSTLVTKRYAWALVGRVTGAIALGFVLVSLVWVLVFHRRLGFGYSADFHILSRLHEQVLPTLIIVGVLQVLGVGGVFLFFALCWTHAISGPLVRVRRWLKTLAEDPPAETWRFRRGDQLHALAEAFQALAHSRQARRAQRALLLMEAQRLLKECEAFRHAADSALLQQRLKTLQGVYVRMRRLYEERHVG